MKTPFISLILYLCLLLSFSHLIAQPPNDDCVNAIPIPLADNETSLILTAGNTIGGTPSGIPINVCSGAWFGDDIWFSFTTGAEIKSNLIFIKAVFGELAGDIPAVGMALYESCDSLALPLSCFSNGDGSRDRLTIFTNSLELNATYYIRVWSGRSISDDSGGVRVAAFYDKEPIDIVVWEETF